MITRVKFSQKDVQWNLRVDNFVYTEEKQGRALKHGKVISRNITCTMLTIKTYLIQGWKLNRSYSWWSIVFEIAAMWYLWCLCYLFDTLIPQKMVSLADSSLPAVVYRVYHIPTRFQFFFFLLWCILLCLINNNRFLVKFAFWTFWINFCILIGWSWSFLCK